MKFIYDGTFEGHYFTCFSMNVHVRVWTFNRGEPKDSVLILASNVTADESVLNMPWDTTELSSKRVT